MGGDLVPYPCHARDTSNRGISECVERSRREVEVRDSTGCTSVSDSDCNAFALICGCDFPVTDGVVVGIDVVVTREVVEKKVGGSGDEVGVGIRDAARAQTSSVESALTGLGANHETWLVAAAVT